MARPLKDGLTYFQHDVNMSADEKLEALEAVHGNDGYAVWNKLLERIFKSYGKLDMKDDVQRLSIAKKCNVTAEKFEAIIADAVRFCLFEREPWESEKRLTSERIRAQLETVEKEREEGRKRRGGYTPPSDELSGCITPVIQVENPSYTGGKHHKAEQSRAEQSRVEKSSSRARENVPVDNSELDLDALFAFALEEARKRKGVRNPEGLARTLMTDANVIAAFRKSLEKPEPPPPDPGPCPSCGGEMLSWPGEPRTRVRCPRCKTSMSLDETWDVWKPDSDAG